MKQVTEIGVLNSAVERVIAENLTHVERATLNPRPISWFVGQAMNATGGKANPKAVNEMVAEKLASPETRSSIQ